MKLFQNFLLARGCLAAQCAGGPLLIECLMASILRPSSLLPAWFRESRELMSPDHQFSMFANGMGLSGLSIWLSVTAAWLAIRCALRGKRAAERWEPPPVNACLGSDHRG